MTERGPEDGQDREPDRKQDPVDHHPPEEWRPGDPGDPMRGGPQPPGEPPHRFPPHDPLVDRHPPEQGGAGTRPGGGAQPAFAPPPGHRPAVPYKAQGDPYQGPGGYHGRARYPAGGPVAEGGSAKLHGDPYQGDDPYRGHGGPAGPRHPGSPNPGPPGPGAADPRGGHDRWAHPSGAGATPAPRGFPPGQHPTGAPPEPVRETGELSEGPSGLEQAGYEHAGYAPGYGETDVVGAGAGSFPSPVPPPGYGTGPQGHHPSGPYLGGDHPPGSYASGGYGYPPGGGYTRSEPSPTPWGKILGIGFGVALLLMLVAGGCMALAMFTVTDPSPTAQESATEAPWPPGAPPVEDAEVTADSADFVPSPLYTSGDYTSVEVSVTNNGEEQVDVNPLYFTVVDTDGQNHSSRTGVGMDDNEIGAETLSPGQATSGAVTVEGELTPERLIFAPIGRQPLDISVD